MVELADTYGSGPYEGNFLQVQVLLPAPNQKSDEFSADFFDLYSSLLSLRSSFFSNRFFERSEILLL